MNFLGSLKNGRLSNKLPIDLVYQKAKGTTWKGSSTKEVLQGAHHAVPAHSPAGLLPSRGGPESPKVHLRS